MVMPIGIKNLYLIVCLSLMFVFSVFSTNYLKVYEKEIYLAEQSYNEEVGQKAILQYYLDKNADEFVKYNKLEILRQLNEENFEVLSDISWDLVEGSILWQDYALFNDKEGNEIARTAPCQTTYTSDPVVKKYCEKEGYKNWFQNQFWKKSSISELGRTKRTWVYKQRLVPKNARTMTLCSDQIITVFEGLSGSVNKFQKVCSEPYILEGRG